MQIDVYPERHKHPLLSAQFGVVGQPRFQKRVSGRAEHFPQEDFWPTWLKVLCRVITCG
jgi:hypothetical protein